MTIGTLATSVAGDPIIVFDTTDQAWDAYKMLDNAGSLWHWIVSFGQYENAIMFKVYE